MSRTVDPLSDRSYLYGMAWGALCRMEEVCTDVIHATIEQDHDNMRRFPAKYFAATYEKVTAMTLGISPEKQSAIGPLQAQVSKIIAQLDMSAFKDPSPLNELFLHGENKELAMLDSIGKDPSIGNRIASARAAADMTQQQLAEKMGCTQKDVSRWESNTRAPTVDTLLRLSDALACTPLILMP